MTTDANCDSCLRPIRLHWVGQARYCPECASARDAIEQMQQIEDTQQRHAVEQYAAWMRSRAWNLGGCFPDMQPLPVDPVRVDAAGSENLPADAGKRSRARGRPPGRPALHPNDRLVSIGMRVPLAVHEKLKRLGREWLVAQVMAAKQPA